MKIHALMVDDNQQAIEDVKKYFKENQEVIEITSSCNDGLEALKELKENHHKYDIVLLDLVIPKKDGISVLEELKKENINIKSIVLTAINSVEIINRCIDCGASYYMLKPYDYASLATIIKNIHNNNKINMVNDKDLKEAITKLLHSLGMPSHIKGYNYIRDGINIMYNNPKILGAITKELYPQIAGLYDTTSSRVERAIRHAIEVSWNRGDYELMEEIFGSSVDYDRSKPTNSEFLATLADKLRLEKR